MENWAGWKEIIISRELVGNIIYLEDDEEEYQYIKVPQGYGYDNYILLVPEGYVRVTVNKEWYLCICSHKSLELVYVPEDIGEMKEFDTMMIELKLFSSCWMTGYELYEKIFKDYEEFYIKECEKENSSTVRYGESLRKNETGTAICGCYIGNMYKREDSFIVDDPFHPYNFMVFFRSNKETFSNSIYKRVQKVNCIFEIMEMSKQQFIQLENLMQEYIYEFEAYLNIHVEFSDKFTTLNYRPIRDRLFCDLGIIENKIVGQLQKHIALLLMDESNKIEICNFEDLMIR